MKLTKEQCQKILEQAKKARACHDNYAPAEEAFVKGHYEKFEQICRGNFYWLNEKHIEFPASIEGPYIRYTDYTIRTGHLNEKGARIGLNRSIDCRTNTIQDIAINNEEGKAYHALNGYLSGSLSRSDPEGSKKALKIIADEIYKSLGIAISDQE